MSDRFRSPPDERYDVIVVGAGIGGLTAAALLAQHGRRVLVVDQHYVAGGNTTIFRRKGYEFDVGLHYIGHCQPDGPIPRTLRAAGASEVEFEEMDPDGYDTLVLPDFRFRVPKGLEPYRARLVAAFPDERRGIDRYVDFLGQVARLQKLGGKKPWQVLREVPRSLLALRHLTSTFGEFLDGCTKNERLRAVLAGQSGDYGLPPSRASAVLAAGLTLHYLDGAYFPKGGGQVMSDRLAESIERSGGRLLLRARVRKILVEGGRVEGVELENPHVGVRRVRAPIVISNADLKRTFLELIGPSQVSGPTLDRVRGFEMSPALGMVYLGLRRDLVAEGHPRTNYWIFSSYDQNAEYNAIRGGRFVDRPSVYITIASVKDPTNRRLAPSGITNLQLISLAPAAPEAWGTSEAEVASGAYRHSDAYRQRKRQFADRLVGGAERVLPGLRSQIEFEEVATPLTHRRYTLSTEGTSYGLALTPEQFLWRRPPARTEIEGLYLCGANCRTGHGIGGAMASGVAAAAAVAGSTIYKAVYGPENATG